MGEGRTVHLVHLVAMLAVVVLEDERTVLPLLARNSFWRKTTRIRCGDKTAGHVNGNGY